MVAKLSKKFGTPEEALRFYSTPSQLRVMPAQVQPKQETATQTDADASDALCTIKSLLDGYPVSEQLLIINQLVQSLAPSGVCVPDDFVSLSLASMTRLHQHGRSNIVYDLAQVLSTRSADGSDDFRMSLSRMPIGLLEYTISFFAADSINEVITRID